MPFVVDNSRENLKIKYLAPCIAPMFYIEFGSTENFTDTVFSGKDASTETQ